MKTIVAIGGGKFGRDDEPYETLFIDKEIVALSGKDSPNILFIPTASNDHSGYIELFRKNFGRILNCKVDVLRVYENAESTEQIDSKILNSDLIYVGGGNTVSMMEKWKALQIDRLLLDAYNRGTILCGLSAGGICWFQNILSDYLKLNNPDAPLAFLPGLNFVSLTLCPHFKSDANRRLGFKEALRDINTPGFGIDDNAAIVLQNEEISIIKSKEDSEVWMCFWNNDQYFEDPIKANDRIKINDLDFWINKVIGGTN
jgi:dipeptidase E